MIWQRNKTTRIVFKTISVLIILAFILYDVSWACNWDFSSAVKNSALRAQSARINPVGMELEDLMGYRGVDLGIIDSEIAKLIKALDIDYLKNKLNIPEPAEKLKESVSIPQDEQDSIKTSSSGVSSTKPSFFKNFNPVRILRNILIVSVFIFTMGFATMSNAQNHTLPITIPLTQQVQVDRQMLAVESYSEIASFICQLADRESRSFWEGVRIGRQTVEALRSAEAEGKLSKADLLRLRIGLNSLRKGKGSLEQVSNYLYWSSDMGQLGQALERQGLRHQALGKLREIQERAEDRQRIAQLEQTTQALEEDLEALQKEKSEILEEASKAKEETADLQQQIRVNIAEIRDLQSQAEQAEEMAQDLEEKFTEEKQRSDALTHGLEESQEEAISHQEKTIEQQDKLIEQKAEISRPETEIATQQRAYEQRLEQETKTSYSVGEWWQDSSVLQKALAVLSLLLLIGIPIFVVLVLYAKNKALKSRAAESRALETSLKQKDDELKEARRLLAKAKQDEEDAKRSATESKDKALELERVIREHQKTETGIHQKAQETAADAEPVVPIEPIVPIKLTDPTDKPAVPDIAPPVAKAKGTAVEAKEQLGHSTDRVAEIEKKTDDVEKQLGLFLQERQKHQEITEPPAENEDLGKWLEAAREQLKELEAARDALAQMGKAVDAIYKQAEGLGEELSEKPEVSVIAERPEPRAPLEEIIPEKQKALLESLGANMQAKYTQRLARSKKIDLEKRARFIKNEIGIDIGEGKYLGLLTVSEPTLKRKKELLEELGLPLKPYLFKMGEGRLREKASKIKERPLPVQVPTVLPVKSPEDSTPVQVTPEQAKALEEQTRDLESERNALVSEIEALKARKDQLESDNTTLSADIARFRQDKNNVVQEITVLEQRLANIKLEIDKKEKAVPEAVSSEAENLRQQIQNLETTKSALEAKIQARNKAKEDIETEISELSNKRASSKEQLGKTHQQITQANTTLSGLSSEIEKLKADKKALEAQSAQLKAEEAESKKALNQAKEALDKVRSELSRLDAEKAQYNLDIAKLSTSKKTIEDESALRQKELLRLREDLLGLQSQADTLIGEKGKKEAVSKDDIDNKTAQIDRLNADIQNLLDQITHKRQELESAQRQKGTLSEEINKLTRQRDSLSQKTAQLERDLQGITAQLDSLKSAEHKQQAELAELAREKESLSANLDKLKSELVLAGKEHGQLKTEIAQLMPQRETLASEVSDLMKQKVSLEKELSRLRKEKEEIEKPKPLPAKYIPSQPYRAMIFDIDNTLTKVKTKINPDMLNELLFFLEQEVQIALVTTQGMDEVKEYILNQVHLKDRRLLKNLTAYPAAGAKCYRFDENGSLIAAPVYDTSKNTPLATSKECEDTVAKAIREKIDSKAKLQYRQGLLTVSGLEDRKRALGELAELFRANGWPLIPRIAGGRTIHILTTGANKAVAAEHFIREIVNERYQQKTPGESLLIVGDSFYPGGLDLDFKNALYGAHIISVGGKPEGSLLTILEKEGIRFSEDLVNAKDWQATQSILKYIRESKHNILQIYEEKAKAEEKAKEDVFKKTPEYMIGQLFDNIPRQDQNIWAVLNNIYPFKDSKTKIKAMLIDLANRDETLRKIIESLYSNLSQGGRIKEEDMLSRQDYEQFKRHAGLKEAFDAPPSSIENGLGFTCNTHKYRLVLAPRDILDLLGGYISADCTDPGFANGSPFLKYVLDHIRSPGFLKFRLYRQIAGGAWEWTGNVYTAVAKNKENQPVLLIDALQLPSKDAGPLHTAPRPKEKNLPFNNLQESTEVAEQIISTLIRYAQDTGFKQTWVGFVSNFYNPNGGLVGYFQKKYAKEYTSTLPPLSRENKVPEIIPTDSEAAYQSRLIEIGLAPIGVDKNTLDSFPRKEDAWTWRGFAKIWPMEPAVVTPVKKAEAVPPAGVEEPPKIMDKPKGKKVVSLPSLLITDIDNTLSEDISEAFKDGNLRRAPEELINRLLYLAEHGTLIALITSQSFAEVNRFFLSRLPKEKRHLLGNFIVYASCSAQCWIYDPKQDNFTLRYDKFKEVLSNVKIGDVSNAIQAKLKELKLDSEIVSQDNIRKSSKIVIHEKGASISIIGIPGEKKRQIRDALDPILDQWPLSVIGASATSLHISVTIPLMGHIDKSFGKEHFLELANKHFNRVVQRNEILVIGYDFGLNGLDTRMLVKNANRYSVNKEAVLDIPDDVISFDEGGDKGWQRTNELLRRIIEGEVTFPSREAAPAVEIKPEPVPPAPAAKPEPQAKKPTYSLMLLDIDDTLSENISGMFKDGKPRYVPDDIINNLIAFAEQGVLVALVTAQSLAEVKKFLISRIPQEKRDLLRNFVIYSSSSAQCWVYKAGQDDFDFVYDKFEEEMQGLYALNVAEEIQKKLKGWGIGGLKTTIVSQADIAQCTGPLIHERGGQITIANIHSDDLQQVIKKVEALIQKRDWPLYVRGIGKHSFHIVVKGMDKSYGREHFLKLAGERLGREIPTNEILVVGNSFGNTGSDRGLIVDGANNFSVGTKKDLPAGVKFFGKGDRAGWERTRELFRRATNGTLKTLVFFLSLSFLLFATPSQAINFPWRSKEPSYYTTAQSITNRIEQLWEKYHIRGFRSNEEENSCIKAIVEIGQPAIPSLIEYLEKTEDVIVSGIAARALGRIGTNNVIQPLIKALECCSCYVHESAIEALAEIGKPAVHPLIEFIKDENNDSLARLYAIQALGKIGDSQAILPLLEAYVKDSKTNFIKPAALEALVKIGQPVSQSFVAILRYEKPYVYDYMTESLGYSDGFVRGFAVYILDEMNWKAETEQERIYYLIAKRNWEDLSKMGPPVIRPLIETLEKVDKDTHNDVLSTLETIAKSTEDILTLTELLELKSLSIQLVAVETLGKSGDLRAVEPLIALLDEKDPSLYKAVIEALGKLKAKQAVWHLIKFLGKEDSYFDTRQIRDITIEALVKIGSPSVPNCSEALENENYRIRDGAKEVLEKLSVLTPELKFKKYIADLKDNEKYAEYRREFAAKELGNMGNPLAVEVLVKALDGKYSRVRDAAANGLLSIARSSNDTKLLIRLLEIENVYINKVVIGILAELKLPQTIGPLIRIFGDSEWEVRQAAIDALVKIGKPAIKSVAECLYDEDNNVRTCAAQTLAKIGEEGIESLITVLNTENEQAKETVIYVLSVSSVTINNPEYFSILIGYLKHENEHIRDFARRSLIDIIGSVKNLELIKRSLVASDPVVRLAAIGSGDRKSAIPKMLEPLIDRLSDQDKSVSQAAEEALVRAISEMKAFGILIKLANLDNTAVRLEALKSLAQLKDKRALSVFIDNITHSDEDIRKQAIIGMSELGFSAKKAVPALIKDLEKEHYEIREVCIKALGKIGSKEAALALMGFLDSDKYPQEAVKDSLNTLAQSSEDTSALLEILELKDQDICFKTIDRLAQIGDATVLEKLFFIASSEFKHSKEKRQKAQKALEIIKNKVSAEEQSKVNAKKNLNLKKYLKPTGIVLLVSALFYGVGLLISYITARLKSKNIKQQGQNNKNKSGQNIVRSLFFLLVFLTPFFYTTFIQAQTIQRSSPPQRSFPPQSATEIQDKETIKRLISEFDNPRDWERRESAKEAIIEIGQPALPALINALEDEESLIRECAADTLGKIKDLRAIPALIKMLQDGIYSNDRSSAAEALDKLNWTPKKENDKISYLVAKKNWNELIEIGQPAVPALIEASNFWRYGGDEYIRASAAKALGRIGDPRAAETLVGLLSDHDYLVQRSAKDALVELGLPAIPQLIKGLEKWDSRVCQRTVTILDKLNWEPKTQQEKISYLIAKHDWQKLAEIGKPAVESLISALGYRDETICECAKRALVAIGEPAVEPLLGVLKGKESSISKDKQIALYGYRVLPGRLPPIAFSGGTVIFNKSPVVEILGEIGDERAIKPLIEALVDKNESLRNAAVEVLNKLKWKPQSEQEKIFYLIAKQDWEGLDSLGQSAIESTIRLLDSENEEVKDAIIFALSNTSFVIKNTDYTPLLMNCLQHENKDVKDFAKRSLIQIIKSAKDIELLKSTLHLSDPQIRRISIEAIETSDMPEMLQPLIERLSDNDASVSRAAENSVVSAISKMQTFEILAKLASLDNALIRLEALKSFTQLKDKRALSIFVNSISHHDKNVREQAIIGLGELGFAAKGAVPVLIKTAKDDDYDIRRASIETVGKICDNNSLAIEYLTKVLKDKSNNLRQTVADSLKSTARSTQDISTLIRLLEVKEFDICLVAIERLAQVGDAAVIDKLSFIASSEFKYSKEERQKAQEALEAIKARTSPEEWKKAAEEKPFSIKKYLKPGGVVLLASTLLYGLGLLTSYITARVKAKNIKQQNQDTTTTLHSMLPFTPLAAAEQISSSNASDAKGLIYIVSALVIVGIFGYITHRMIKKAKYSLSQRSSYLPFYKTLGEIISLRKSEKTSEPIIIQVLRLGTKNRIGGFTLWLLGTSAILAGLIIFNVILTYIGAVAFLVITAAAGWSIQSEKGIKTFRSLADYSKIAYRLLIYPATYLIMATDYARSSALNPEHFYLLRRFKKEQGERMFDEVKDLAVSKLGKDAQWPILDMAINLAYEMSKKGKDIRDLLEIQVPVAIEISSSVDDFKVNLGIVEQILTGPYDIKLIKDKQKFKAFFEKVGKDLKPASIEQTVETIGLLEHRLVQQGFNVNHFYDEVFKGMDKQTLDGAMDIIFEIIRQGFFPTAQLINMAKAAQDRKQLYRDWRSARLQIQTGNFDINNSLHIELEYSTFRRILDTSRIISQQGHFRGYLYKDYLRVVRHRDDDDLGRKEKAEIIYAAYEGLKLQEFINEVKQQANSFGREVWVIPNLSLGRFAAVFVENDLRLNEIDIAFAKIGSSEMHNTPFNIDPRFIRSQLLHRIVSEKPVIVVVDASMHLLRYPDAHQGYLNLAIALNDVISDGDVAKYAGVGGRNRGFINGLKKTSSFKAIRKTIQKEYDTVSKKDPVLYTFHFWNPRGAKLDIRSSWITHRGIVGKPKPLDPKKLNGPAVIFVNTVLDDKDIPKEIKEKAGNIEHTAGYFDDKEPCKTGNLLFRVDKTGIHLADSMHELEMETMAKLIGKNRGTRRAPLEPVVPVADTSKLVNVSSDFTFAAEGQNLIKIRRLIDELTDTNSKIRTDTAAALGEYAGNETVAVALRKCLLHDKREDVRYWAASSLGLLGLVESAKVLSAALTNDSSSKVKAEAARSIGRLGGSQAIPLLSEVLNKTKDIEVKKEILFALRSLCGNDALVPLLKTLKEDKNPILRTIAAEAYLDVGREDTALEALKCFDDKSELVRTTIAEGLGDLSDSLGNLTDDVVDALSKLLLQDNSPMVRQKTAWALGQIGDINAFKVIETALKTEWDSDVKEMLVWAKGRLLKTKEAIPAPKAKRAKVALMEEKLSPIKEKPKTQETVQDSAKAITIQGAKIDLSKTHGFIFDLDGTLAPLSQPVPLAINEALIRLLKTGRQLAIVTAEIEENLESRVWGQIPDELRRNLHCYSNGGTKGFGFDPKGEKVSYYDYTLSAKDRTDILGVVNFVLSNRPFSIQPEDYKVKIHLGHKILKQRYDIAVAIQESLKLAGIEATVSFQGGNNINIHKFDKIQAVREFLSRTNLDEENLFIVADKARGFGADRGILTSFSKAVSINVGSTSPTIQKENPNVIQTGIKHLLATEAILNIITGKSQVSFEETTAPLLSTVSYTDTEDDSQISVENDLEAEADKISQKYHGIKIGVIGATAPTKDYSSELGQQLGRQLGKYVFGKGFVFTGGVAGVGVDVYKGISEGSDEINNNFFVLLPVAEKADAGYGKVETVHIGINKFERRIGMGKIADVLIVLNGKGGTLHEAVSALENGTKVIALNHGGAGSLLYNAKAKNALLPELTKTGFKYKYLENVLLSDIAGVEKALDQALKENPDDLVTAMAKRQKAMQELVEKGKEIVPALLGTIEKTNSFSQMEGLAEVLSRIADVRALPILQRLQQKHRSSMILEKAVMRLLSSANAERGITTDALYPEESVVSALTSDIKSGRIDPAHLRNIKKRTSALQRAA